MSWEQSGLIVVALIVAAREVWTVQVGRRDKHAEAEQDKPLREVQLARSAAETLADIVEPLRSEVNTLRARVVELETIVADRRDWESRVIWLDSELKKLRAQLVDEQRTVALQAERIAALEDLIEQNGLEKPE